MSIVCRMIGGIIVRKILLSDMIGNLISSSEEHL